jgi:hypothetical protein
MSKKTSRASLLGLVGLVVSRSPDRDTGPTEGLLLFVETFVGLMAWSGDHAITLEARASAARNLPSRGREAMWQETSPLVGEVASNARRWGADQEA